MSFISHPSGPDKNTLMNAENVPSDLKQKLVIYYAAKACHKHVCRDLTPGPNPRDGALTGHKVVTWDVKVCEFLDFGGLYEKNITGQSHS